MNHSFLDHYCDGDSIFHRLDARTKLIFVVMFVFSVVLLPPASWFIFAFYFTIIFILTLAAKLPVSYVFKRSLAVIPFVLMVAIFLPFFKSGEVAGSYNIWFWEVTITYDGIYAFLNILAKSWLSILSLIWLTSTTRLTHILYALEWLRFPHVLVMILSFMYRYIFVIVDEMMRMKQARDSRNFGGSIFRHLRTMGNMIGTLFVRSYERSERVYTAMVARGFDGHVCVLNQLRFKKSDAFFGIGLGLVLVFTSVVSLLL